MTTEHPEKNLTSMTPADNAPSRDRAVCALVVCALLLLFAAFSWLAASDKSSTFDEPVHALGSWVLTYHNDFRVDPENPPLFQHWAALPQGPNALKLDLHGAAFDSLLKTDALKYTVTPDVLYNTPGNDGEAFIRRSRNMMLMIGVAVGAVMAMWSWRLAGALAAVVATALFALDPNMLGHAPLVKNDIPLVASMIWLAMATWLCGQGITWVRALSLALAISACVTTKFNGLLAIPQASLLLGIRALMPAPWKMLGRELTSRARRLAAAVGVMLFCCFVCWIVIWSLYHFRYDATIQPGVMLDSDAMHRRLARWWLTPLRIVADHHLLPQAWVHGLLLQVGMMRHRTAFLLGNYSQTGWWYYFPLAMLFKTPVTTLVVLTSAMVAFLWMLNRKRPGERTVWSIVCVALPFVIFLGVSMTSKMNIGLRHVFPLFPLMYVAAGVMAAKLWSMRPKLVTGVLILFGITLAIESFVVFPNYIAYFNFACGGSRGGLRLLGDSNLDWGQDLPALQAWQQEHPGAPLFLIYFGTVPAEPAYHLRLTPRLQDAQFVAISATCLQGIYNADEATRAQWRRLRQQAPIEVLNGSIYIFDVKQVGASLAKPQPPLP